MNILGLNVFHADTSNMHCKGWAFNCCYRRRKIYKNKHFSGFPKNSIDFCIKEQIH